jgi:hypothetical protein
MIQPTAFTPVRIFAFYIGSLKDRARASTQQNGNSDVGMFFFFAFDVMEQLSGVLSRVSIRRSGKFKDLRSRICALIAAPSPRGLFRGIFAFPDKDLLLNIYECTSSHVSIEKYDLPI